MSTTVTSLPRSARQAAVVRPTYPAPITATLLKPGGLSLDQHVPDLRQDCVRSAKHVSRRKAQQPDARRKKPILAPIVLDEIQAMELTVIFEAQLVLAVVQVGAAKESPARVIDSGLHLRTRQPVQHEQHA